VRLQVGSYGAHLHPRRSSLGHVDPMVVHKQRVVVFLHVLYRERHQIVSPSNHHLLIKRIHTLANKERTSLVVSADGSDLFESLRLVKRYDGDGESLVRRCDLASPIRTQPMRVSHQERSEEEVSQEKQHERAEHLEDLPLEASPRRDPNA